jgi:hypothetical protein
MIRVGVAGRRRVEAARAAAPRGGEAHPRWHVGCSTALNLLSASDIGPVSGFDAVLLATGALGVFGAGSNLGYLYTGEYGRAAGGSF